MTFSFGTAANKPAFGTAPFSFGGNTATTSAPAFNFGPTATTNTGFGGFGNTATTSSAGINFGGFGAQTTSAPSLFGGLGTTTTSTSAFPSFGANTTTSFGTGTNLGFGQSAFGTAAPSFGTGTANTFGTGSAFGSTFGNTGSTFGTGGSLGFGGFGNNFGAKPLGAPTFPSFGTGLGTAGFGQPQQQQQQQQQVNPNEALVNAVHNCNIFNDERDQILAEWNFLQAKWGFGKAFYANNQPPIELTEQNPLCRFKAIGYSCMPNTTENDGLVQLIFNKPEQEIKNQQQQLHGLLLRLFGNKPNLTITIDSIKGISENKCEATIFVIEKSLTGNSAGSRISSTEVAQFLNTPMQRQQLTSLGITAAISHAKPDARQLQQYIETPPPGIDLRLWKQAHADNPDPERYLPVPIIGFGEVKWRIRCQEEETKLHTAFLNQASDELAELKAKHAATHANLQDQRRRYMDLHHRLLTVVVRQESARRAGSAMTSEEEALRSRLEAIHAQLAAPTQFNGRLSELSSQIRMQKCQNISQPMEKYAMDHASQDDIKQFLTMQQKGISHLIETVQTVVGDLKIIQEGMTKIVTGQTESGSIHS